MLSLVFYVFRKTKLVIRSRVCNVLLALLQMKETCCSKLSSESIKILSNVSFVQGVSEASPIYTLLAVLELRSK